MARKQPMSIEEFNGYKAHQYCDNKLCPDYSIVGSVNLINHSIIQGQLRCSGCKGKPFSVRKGTMFFRLRTPIEKIVRSLLYLASGTGQNAVCRIEGVQGSTLRFWILLASEQVEAFTGYMQQDMHLEQIQIDEFWSFIKKKRESDR
jgi:hypothetical protein